MKQKIAIEGIDVFIEGQGQDTIVMIHGWPDTYRLWDAQVEFFRSTYRCVRFTLPGFDINKPCRAYALEETMKLFKTIIQQATSPNQKVILMLHDWGCFFGYHFYMQNPSMVSRIIGVDIGDTNSIEFQQSLKIKHIINIISYQLWLNLAWCIGGRLGNKMTQFLARFLNCKSDPNYMSACMNYPYYILWFKSYGSYKAVKAFFPSCPMLFIYANNSPIMWHSRAWAERLSKQPGCKVIAMDTSHWVMVDEPDKFNQAVLDWLTNTF